MSASDGVSYYKKPEPRETVEQAIADAISRVALEQPGLAFSLPHARAALDAALAAGCLLPETAEDLAIEVEARQCGMDDAVALLREARPYVAAHESDPQHLTVSIDAVIRPAFLVGGVEE